MNSASRRGRLPALRLGRWLTWLIGGLLVIVLASYVALPIGLSWYLPELAHRYGIQLAVESVRTAPFESRVHLLGVRVGAIGGATTEWASIEARVDLEALLGGRVVLGEFRMSEARFYPDESSEDSVDPGTAFRSSALAESVDFGEFTIESVELAKFSELLGRPVAVDRLRLESLADLFRPEGSAVQADFSVGEGRARVDGTITSGVSGWILDANVSSEGMPLDGFPALFGVDRRWRGTLEGTGPVRLLYSPATDAFSATTGGQWRIDGLVADLADTVTVRAQVDGDGTVFIVLLGGVVDTLSIDAALRLRGLGLDVADAFEADATEVTLRIDASQALATRISVEGTSPEVRVRGAGDVFDAKAGQIAAGFALSVANGTAIEVDRLETGTLEASLPDGGSIAVNRLELARMDFDSDTNVLSGAMATARRIDWRDLAASQGSGTATGIRVRGIERVEGGTIRLGQVSVETLNGANPGPSLRMHDVVLDSAAIAPTGQLTLEGLQASDSWLSDQETTLVLERLSIDGIERTPGGGVVSVAAGRADVVDHSTAAGSAMLGKEVEFAGALVAGDSWGAAHLRFGHLDLANGDAGYAFRMLALTDMAGEGRAGTARDVRLGEMERWFHGNRVVGEGLNARSVAWNEDGASAGELGASSLALDLMGRYRWQVKGGRLSGVDASVSGNAHAEAASMEALGMHAGEESIIGMSNIRFDGLAFDGAAMLRASSAMASRARFQARADITVDATGLHAEAIEWNGENLVAQGGTAPLMSVRVAPVRASLDGVEFETARFGAGGLQQLDALSAASFRGGVTPGSELQWTAGESNLTGYRAPGSGAASFDLVETRAFEALAVGDDSRFRAERFAIRGVRMESSGDMRLSSARADGAMLGRPDEGRLSAAVLLGRRVVLRDSGLEIGSLDLSGLEATLGMNEKGEWDLPLPPLGIGGAGAPYSVRIDEAGTADHDTVVHVVDRTTEPDFAVRLDIASATLRGFSSSPTGVTARFSVECVADAFSSARFEGTLIPTLTGIDLDVNADLRGLTLAAFSPYVQLHLGQDLAAGQADAFLTLEVRSSDLDGVVDLRPSGVRFQGASSPADRSVVESALALIEERRGAVELRASLRGGMDDPGFDFDSLLVHALANSALENAERLEKTE